MTDSTKQKIKKTALTLFARRGYDGTTMNDIAKEVGIKTPSLYAHFKGKEELFFSIYEDLANQYVNTMDEIINTAHSMEIEEKLYYIFERYVVYYIKNPEIHAFWNQITMFTPPELKEKFYSHVINCDNRIQKKLEEIFTEGVKKEVLREENPVKMSWSCRMMSKGLLYWMTVVPELRKEELIKTFWNDLWLGLKR